MRLSHARVFAFASLCACAPGNGAPASNPAISSVSAEPLHSPEPQALSYPAARRDSVSETLQGITVADPYRWLEREKDPEVQQWLAGQETFARKVLSGIPIRRELEERLGKLLYSGNVEPPKRGGARYFFTLRKPGQEKSVLYAREQGAAADRVVIDPNLWPSVPPRALQHFWPSNDGKRLVFSTSLNNNDRETFQVLDVDSGAISDQIEGIYDSGASWNATGDGFYYRWSPADQSIPLPDLPSHAEVRFHRLGKLPATDRTIRKATGDAHITEYLNATQDGHWLLLRVERGFTRQDILAFDLRNPAAGWTPISAQNDVWSEASETHDAFILKTNDGAPRGRVFRIDAGHRERSRWKEIAAERPDATLVKSRVVADRVFLLWHKDDISELESCALDGSDRQKISLPGVGFMTGLSGNPDDDAAFATFESYTVPAEVLEISPTSPALRVWQRVESPINPDDYVTEEVFYSSKDGSRIPMFIVRRKDVKPSGKAPTVYWGYGGFGVSVILEFDADIFAWLDQGGIYVEVGIRGGGDYGEEWHRAGMRTHKQNAIDDYLAGAEALIKWNWTDSDHLMACGGSNGGILVGAAITQRPELFRAAFLRSPLLDMVRYPLFGSGKQWEDEYGSPEDPVALRALLSYSPYHNIKAGVRYPSVLVYSADSDDRVDPMHARKFVAALQAATTGGPVVLSMAKNGGHYGPDGVKGLVDRYADAYAFGFHAMGLDHSATTP
jgi:prolyl oligopeptidase